MYVLAHGVLQQAEGNGVWAFVFAVITSADCFACVCFSVCPQTY